MSSDRQELIRRFALAIVQGNPTTFEIVWPVATMLADAEPQPEPEPQPQHTRENWAELQGDVTRLTKDVHRLSGAVESLEARIQRAVALLRGATRYDTAAGFAVTEDRVDEAIQTLEGQE